MRCVLLGWKRGVGKKFGVRDGAIEVPWESSFVLG